MAGPAFKQECPSCEAQVTIRDASLIGKKVKCPTCKYVFAVAKPAGANASVKPGAAPAAKKPAAKPAPAETEAPPAPAAAASRKKMLVGLVLGAVGLAVLGYAGLNMIGKPSTKGGGGGGSQKMTKGLPPDEEDDDDGKKAKTVDDKDKKDLKKPVAPVVVDTRPINPPTSELTNLLPGDADHVFHGYFGTAFAFTGMLRTVVFGEPGTLDDASLKPRLGFSPLAVDDLVRADKFGDPGWVYIVVHLNEHVDEKAFAATLDLKKQTAIGKHVWWKADRRNPTLGAFDRLSIGAPSLARALTPADDRPLAVHVYDTQTIIFADEVPLKAFLTSRSPLSASVGRPSPRETRCRPIRTTSRGRSGKGPRPAARRRPS